MSTIKFCSKELLLFRMHYVLQKWCVKHLFKHYHRKEKWYNDKYFDHIIVINFYKKGIYFTLKFHFNCKFSLTLILCDIPIVFFMSLSATI